MMISSWRLFGDRFLSFSPFFLFSLFFLQGNDVRSLPRFERKLGAKANSKCFERNWSEPINRQNAHDKRNSNSKFYSPPLYISLSLSLLFIYSEAKHWNDPHYCRFCLVLRVSLYGYLGRRIERLTINSYL